MNNSIISISHQFMYRLPLTLTRIPVGDRLMELWYKTWQSKYSNTHTITRFLLPNCVDQGNSFVPIDYLEIAVGLSTHNLIIARLEGFSQPYLSSSSNSKSIFGLKNQLILFEMENSTPQRFFEFGIFSACSTIKIVIQYSIRKIYNLLRDTLYVVGIFK